MRSFRLYFIKCSFRQNISCLHDLPNMTSVCGLTLCQLSLVVCSNFWVFSCKNFFDMVHFLCSKQCRNSCLNISPVPLFLRIDSFEVNPINDSRVTHVRDPRNQRQGLYAQLYFYISLLGRVTLFHSPTFLSHGSSLRNPTTPFSLFVRFAGPASPS